VHECRLRLDALEADLLVYCDKDPYAEGVHRLCCYRGVNTIGALTLVSEVCDWRRFAKASSFMGFVGDFRRSELFACIHAKSSDLPATRWRCTAEPPARPPP